MKNLYLGAIVLAIVSGCAAAGWLMADYVLADTTQRPQSISNDVSLDVFLDAVKEGERLHYHSPKLRIETEGTVGPGTPFPKHILVLEEKNIDTEPRAIPGESAVGSPDAQP